MPTGHYLSLYIYQENLVVKIPKIAKNGQKTGMKKTEKILTVSSYPSLMAIRIKMPTRGTTVVTIIIWPKMAQNESKWAKIEKYLLCRRIHLLWQLGSKRPQEVLQLSQVLAKISHLWVVRSVNMRNRSWPAFEIARINWAVKKSAMNIWTSWCYCSVKKRK